jgi:hypothetical protein
MTYATLRIFGEDLDPDEMTSRLGLRPSRSHRQGDPKPGADRYEAQYGHPPSPYRQGYWSFETEEALGEDALTHIDQLLEIAEARGDELAKIREAGYSVDIFIFWPNWHGHGGPYLDAGRMTRLGNLGIAISWDVYEAVDD